MFKAYAVSEPGGKLEPFEYDPGDLKATQVEIDVQYCGICRSDLSVMDNEWGNARYPVVPGHEVVGTVAAVGHGVTHLKTGQLVGLGWHAEYCGICPQCLRGDQNLCASAQPTIVGHYGGFADKVRADAAAVIPIPDGVDPESAGPLFCGGITVFNPLMQFNVRPTDRAAVVGIGGLGHMALQFLRAWGCHVTAFTSNPDKKQQALEMGAHETLNSQDPKDLKRAAGRFDLILSTVFVKLDWNRYIAMLAPKGRLHFVGAVLEPLDVEAFPLIVGQRSLSGSPVGAPGMIATMLEFVRRHRIRPMIETFPMSEANTAVERLRKGEVRYRAVLSR